MSKWSRIKKIQQEMKINSKNNNTNEIMKNKKNREKQNRIQMINWIIIFSNINQSFDSQLRLSSFQVPVNHSIHYRDLQWISWIVAWSISSIVIWKSLKLLHLLNYCWACKVLEQKQDSSQRSETTRQE